MSIEKYGTGVVMKRVGGKVKKLTLTKRVSPELIGATKRYEERMERNIIAQRESWENGYKRY